MNAEPELPELTPEMIQSGCRLCTEEDMQKMPKLFPDGHPNFPTFGHFKLPHPDERVTVQ